MGDGNEQRLYRALYKEFRVFCYTYVLQNIMHRIHRFHCHVWEKRDLFFFYVSQ